MKKISAVFTLLMASIMAFAQMPPSNMYQTLGAYVSVAVYEDGEEIPFEGTDYFFVDYIDDTEVNALFYDNYRGRWISESADFIEQTSDYTKFTVVNPAGDDLTFIISPDKMDLLAAKDYEDITVAYQLIDGGGYGSSSYGYPSVGSYNGGNYGGSSSSSGRSCSGCHGTGKCTMCNGQGWYYQETGYYTGNSRREKTTCPSCHGTGRCGVCHGKGTIY